MDTHACMPMIRTGSILRNQVHAGCTWFKKGIGIKSVKYANNLEIKQYGNRLKIQLKGYYKMEINSKTLAIPILTASGL